MVRLFINIYVSVLIFNFNVYLSIFILLYVILFLLISEPICVEDLENILHEFMLLTFNTEIEDGSIEQVYTHTLDVFSHVPFLINFTNFICEICLNYVILYIYI